MELFDKYTKAVEAADPIKYNGRIVKVQGLLLESFGPQAVVGEICEILVPRGTGTVLAEVVGLRDEYVQLMPFTNIEGIEIGCTVIATGEFLTVPVSDKLLGRTLDGMGRPIDGLGDVASSIRYPAVNTPPDVLMRKRITERIVTGVRSIDMMLTAGKGQRLGIFSGSGVGKSTLMGMIARNTEADVNVIALIGERGREVREFIENDLGPEGLARSVIIVSSSNNPPLARLRGAYVATAVAEYFRDRGKDVMLLFDSITRYARAQREIGLAIGEPPATRGYPPSVFETMPKLLERCGTSEHGTVTGFYTILVDGDDMDEPIADTVRGILDGHIVLSRRLAQRNHYPAVDVLASVSRLQPIVSGPITKKVAGNIRKLLATYAEFEDLINVGAYVKGTNPSLDVAIEKRDSIENFLVQAVEEKAPIKETFRAAGEIVGIAIPYKEISDYSGNAAGADDEENDDSETPVAEATRVEKAAGAPRVVADYGLKNFRRVGADGQS